jgi:hypothetical protein
MLRVVRQPPFAETENGERGERQIPRNSAFRDFAALRTIGQNHASRGVSGNIKKGQRASGLKTVVVCSLPEFGPCLAEWIELTSTGKNVQKSHEKLAHSLLPQSIRVRRPPEFELQFKDRTRDPEAITGEQ